jgi:hypothetical protein
MEVPPVPDKRSVSKARLALPPASLLVALALASGAASAAEKIAVVPVENGAKATADEIAILTNTVVAALSAKGTDFEIVPISIKAGESCNRLCVFNRAKVTGARYLVTGAVALFGGQYVLKFEVQDRITGTIVASANTPAVATLPELLPRAKDAAATLRNELTPEPAPPPPAIAPPIAAAPPVQSSAPSPQPPPAKKSKRIQPTGMTGVLSVTSTPPGAKVRLRSPNGVAFGALGRTGSALSRGWGGSLLGVTPVKKSLYQGTYELRVELDGYETQSGGAATVYVGETTGFHVDLEPSRALLKGGVALTFGGTVVTVVGAILAGMRKEETGGSLSGSQAAGIVLLISGGAMVIGGVAMWVVHYRRTKKEEPPDGAVALLPIDGGLAAGYSRSF